MTGPTETHREPTPDDVARADEGGHAAAHPGDIPGEAHGVGDHGDGHGHGDHGHSEETLGPVNWPAWAALAVGIVAGLLVAGGLVMTVAVSGSAIAG
jgi:hypothetical protein